VWLADCFRNAPVEPEDALWNDRVVEAAINDWSRKVSNGVSKISGCVQRVKSSQPTSNLSEDEVIKMSAAMYSGMAMHSAVRGKALANPSSSGRPKKIPTCSWLDTDKVPRQRDTFSSAAGVLAAEVAARGNRTAEESVGERPNRRGGFAESLIGLKAGKIHLADARAAGSSAAKTDSKVGVALNRMTDASDPCADAARSANELEADRFSMYCTGQPSPCPLQAQASGTKISGNLIVGCNGCA